VEALKVRHDHQCRLISATPTVTVGALPLQLKGNVVRFTLATLALLVAPFAFTGVAAPVPKEDPAKAELDKLNGTWEITSFMRAGEERLEDIGDKVIRFKNGEFTWGDNDEPSGKVASIDPSKTPKELDYTYEGQEGKPQKAIYKLDKDTFTDCFNEKDPATRPKEFKSTEENGLTVVTYKRVKKKD
jgi:uncharacterized protein (TIGR03067 family)